ncbi:MAG: spiro-SPASM protein [Treponema sp.]|jgi:spiro-SPASM protein|nr:spiro-SPASM protein [Treponema sp.]
MNALAVLFAGRLAPQALEPVFSGKNALDLALEQSRRFPGVSKILLLAEEGGRCPSALPDGVPVLRRPEWTKQSLLECLAAEGAGFDLSYFAWADCPFLDPLLTGAVAERHLRYAAEYSYADGWPYGFAPELLSPGTAGILAKINGGDEGPVERDGLFSVLQKDINAFDIETEISAVDLRCHRLCLAADSKRNLLLLARWAEAAGGLPDAASAAELVEKRPGLLRTLPAFYPIQVSGPCPQACQICPYPHHGKGFPPVTERRDFMDTAVFSDLLDRIAAFSGDAVIDLSLWGELALHPRKTDLIGEVLARRELSLVIETSGIGWRQEELEGAAKAAAAAPGRPGSPPPLSWIVSLDAFDEGRYRELRGPGFTEALSCARTLFSLFPAGAYVQAVRTEGAEDDIEKFYRSWKDAAPRGVPSIIIQKYDDFCGALPKRQASDISPVIRRPCWHIMRDFPVLIDGTVPLCREELSCLERPVREDGRVLGNIFSESLEEIWSHGEAFYEEHCGKQYAGLCAGCDEYYTYNF